MFICYTSITMKLRTTIYIDDEVMKEAKKKAIDEDKTLSQYLEDLINKDTQKKE